MSDESRKVICHDCMKPVPENRACFQVVHAGRGMEEQAFCRKCATYRGIDVPGGPKIIR